MAGTGRDAGGRGPSLPWRYSLREQTGRSNSNSYSYSYDNSISSSSSGTIVSISTTYTSSGSRLSSMSASHLELALDEDTECVQPIKKIMDISLVKEELFGAPSSAERSISINSGDMSVLLQRWFSELGVAWVLHLPDGDDASAELHHTSAAAAAAESWKRGLHRIMETTIRSTSTVFSGQPGVCKEEDQPVPESDKQANNVPDQIYLLRFTKEAMSKMFPFVDFAIRQVVVSINRMPTAPYKKLHALLAVYEALSDASLHSTSAGSVRILEEMVNLVSAKQEEAGEAIWSTMETIRTRVLGSIDTEYYGSSSLMAQASSDIHKATLSVMEYISFLCSNSSSVRQIVSKAICLGKYVPRIRQEQPMDSMIMDLNSCLQEKLVKMSESFLDQGLRFLFLLNNLEFIRQSLVHNHFCYWLLLHEEGEGISEKVEGYIDNYLQACWEPVLACLFSPTPLCFGINYFPLPKFEYEFKKAYATQKLWKVRDPKLRERLRRAITKKIVPRYTEYIEENNIATPGVATRNLENMLQELFEG